MLWSTPGFRNWDLRDDVDDFHRGFHRFLGRLSEAPRTERGEFPAVNIWTGEDDAVLTAEIPGLDLQQLEITVKNDTITIRGHRVPEKLKDGQTYLRQERGSGRFVRSFSLPFRVEADQVAARYQSGVLEVKLPKAEVDKPRKIAVTSG